MTVALPPLPNERVLYIQKSNPRPSHLEQDLHQDMEWNAIKAVINEQTNDDFAEYLAPELHGIHNLLLAVDAKLKHWRAKNTTCIVKNTLTMADVHMVIHTIKFFSPRRTAWRLTHDLFRAEFTMSEMHDAACCVKCQPLRDNLVAWIAQHYRLIVALIEEDISQNRRPNPFQDDVYTDEQSDSEDIPHRIWWESHTSPTTSSWTPVQRFPSVTYNIPPVDQPDIATTETYVPDLSVDWR